MTDSFDETETDQSRPPPTPSVDSEVPADTEWELEVQSSFAPAEKHDLTSTIIESVAEAEGASPTEIKEPPLYDVLDVAALEEALFGSSDIEHRDSDRRLVEFMYRSHRVVIRSDGWVQIYRSTGE